MRPHLEVLSVKSTSGFLSIIQKAAVSAIYKPCSPAQSQLYFCQMVITCFY